MRHPSAILAALFALNRAVVSQETLLVTETVILTYTTATITQCFTNNGFAPACSSCAAAAIIHRPAIAGQLIGVQVQAPRCNKCGCNTCVHTIAYTTAYDAFCPTGLFKQVYAVTETYSGMALTPTVASTDIPFGFTREVQTCTTCGPVPISATITYPISSQATAGAMVSDSHDGAAGAKASDSHDGITGTKSGSMPLPSCKCTFNVLVQRAEILNKLQQTLLLWLAPA